MKHEEVGFSKQLHIMNVALRDHGGKRRFSSAEMGRVTCERLNWNSIHWCYTHTHIRRQSIVPIPDPQFTARRRSPVWIDGRPRQPISARRVPKPCLFHLADQSESPSAAECVIRVECECGLPVTGPHSAPIPHPEPAMAAAFLPLCPSHVQLVKAMCTKLGKEKYVFALVFHKNACQFMSTL